MYAVLEQGMLKIMVKWQVLFQARTLITYNCNVEAHSFLNWSLC